MAENNTGEVQNNEQTEISYSDVVRIRREKLELLKTANQNPFEVNTYKRTAYTEQITDNFDELEGVNVSIAGRMMSRRDMGKANFVDIRDRYGRIQVYVRVNDIGEDNFASYKKWDIGDIVGVEGKVFRTRRGEISIHATKLVLLSKSLLPLPEKWHGLKDTDLRYRQRYLDLIVNPDVRETFEKRSKIIKEIRNFLDSRDFLEVETPVLQTLAGGAAARPFITHHNSLGLDMYLRISLELYLKRLIVGGFERVYEIGRVFRNEGMSVRHNPEFTLLELYEAYTDYEGMMNLTEDMFRHVAQTVCGTGKIVCGEHELDLDKPFERLSMVDAVRKYAGIDFDKVDTLEEARKIAEKHHIKYEKHHLKGDILNLLFDEMCEDKIIQPTFIMHHPVEISPLAKKSPLNPAYTERFEVFIIGREFANAFSEINDPIDQRERFERQAELKAAGDDEANEIDEDFITSLEYGMPPTGGLGVGIDRLVMLLTNSASIRDVLLFPTMKPISKTQDSDDKE